MQKIAFSLLVFCMLNACRQKYNDSFSYNAGLGDDFVSDTNSEGLELEKLAERIEEETKEHGPTIAITGGIGLMAMISSIALSMTLKNKNGSWFFKKYKENNDWMKKFDQMTELEKSNYIHELKKTVATLLEERKAAGLGDSKIKLLLLTFSVGGGHNSAMESIKQALSPYSDLFEISEIDPFKGSQSEDLTKMARAGYSAEFAEKAARGKKFGEWILNQKPIKYWLYREMKAVTNPDMVISAQPVANRAFASMINERFSAQLRVVPTDFGMKDFLDHIKDLPAEYGGLRYDIAASDQYIIEQLNKKNISSFTEVGTPIRKEIIDFANAMRSTDETISKSAKNGMYAHLNDQVKKSTSHSNVFDSKTDKSIFLSLGGAGIEGSAYRDYIEQIRNYIEKEEGKGILHVFIPNEQENSHVMQLTEELEIEDKLAIHVLGRQNGEQMAMLMAAGPMIAKPGGLTAFEGQETAKHMIFSMIDAQHYHWESGNADYLEKKGIATKLPVTKEAEKKDFSSVLKKAFATDNGPLTKARTTLNMQERYPVVLLESIKQQLQFRKSLKIK